MKKIITILSLMLCMFATAQENATGEYMYIFHSDNRIERVEVAKIDSVTFVDPYQAVDLGLPSGIKWASFNVGARAPWEYGGYYAWGETEEKEDYSWETYKWCNGSDDTMTKYCTNSSYGTIDNKIALDPEDDVATVQWGGEWRIPTSDEIEELKTKCTWQETILNGINGYEITGPNGNSIFMPVAGYGVGNGVYDLDGFGRYWSSELKSGSNDAAYGLDFGNGYYWNGDYRWHGRSVRPVCGESIVRVVTVTSNDNGTAYIYSRDAASEIFLNGASVTVVATPDANCRFLGWFVGDSEVAVSVDVAYTFIVAEDVELTAMFEEIKYVVSVNTSANGAVAVKDSEGNSAEFVVGSVATVVATPDSGYEFAGWFIGDSDTAVSTDAAYTFTIGEDVALVARFEKIRTYLNGYEYIDLGLPSGTKWAAYNVGATKPEEFGGFYAWGETEEKDDYSESTYKFGYYTTNDNGLIKYYHYSKYIEEQSGVFDREVLEPEDDVAYVKWGGGWRMPTNDECAELLENCTQEWATINGVEGCKLTGPNGNTIFLPAPGEISGTIRANEGMGFYWNANCGSGRTHTQTRGFYLGFRVGSYSYCGITSYYRETGMPVRPVCGTPAAPVVNYTVSVLNNENGIVLINGENVVSASVAKGTEVTVTAIANDGYEFAGWFIGDSDTAVSTDAVYTFTVSQDIALVAKYYKTLNTNGYDFVDLGLPSGIKWAAYNVGATKPEEFGGYYAWGETEEKEDYSWETYKWCNGSSNTLTKYCINGSYGAVDNKIALDPEDDVATVQWGGDWRMPTEAEQEELRNNCDWEWVEVNGVTGYRVKSRVNDNSIFLPAAGYRDRTYVDRGAGNGYCSNAVDSDFNDNACGMRFEEGNYDWSSFGRSNGRPVRPVCK